MCLDVIVVLKYNKGFWVLISQFLHSSHFGQLVDWPWTADCPLSSPGLLDCDKSSKSSWRKWFLCSELKDEQAKTRWEELQAEGLQKTTRMAGAWERVGDQSRCVSWEMPATPRSPACRLPGVALGRFTTVCCSVGNTVGESRKTHC